MTSHVDGDDYTDDWRTGGAVLNSTSHTACEVCGQPATEILYGTVPAGVENGWRLFKPGIQHCYCAGCAAAAHVEPLDLHTPDQKIANVALRVDTLMDALQALTWRVEALEQAGKG